MNTKSSIQSDVEITGSIVFQGELTFDGQLKDGSITGEILIVGNMAQIDGNIEAGALLLSGAVTGDVMVPGRCEIRDTASLVGNLVSNRLVMHEGATLIGSVAITPDAKTPSAQPTARASDQFPIGVRNLAKIAAEAK